MKFSIITPSLNQGPYIRQTIESVLAQKGDFEVEYFVVDGGSTDETQDVLREYEGRLTWWVQSGKGQSQAINEGLHRATGDLLAWINSDDYYEPGALEEIAQRHKEHPDNDLFCGQCFFRFENESGSHTDLRTPEEPTLENVTVRGHRIYQPAAFFTKRIIDRIGPLDESLHYVMDYDLWVRILRQSHARLVPRPLATFRIWGASKTSTARERFVAEWRTVQKRYGLPRVNPKDIHRLSANIFADFFRQYTPALYDALKRRYYALSRRIT
jgi:glycosyltransferase involved in cell wall biosynthesis